MLKIGDKRLGYGCPCFIVFEAGPTHDGVETAKALVKHAAESGADAIKFSISDPDRVIGDKNMMFSYNVLVDRETGRMETVTEPLYDIICRRYLTEDQWREVKAFCDEMGLLFFATIGFEEGLRLLESLGAESLKIASADVNHFPLIRKAARTGMCLQLDTGNATLGEIEQAVEVIRSEQNDRIIIHNCPSGYPARLESINLRLIKTLKMLYPEYVIAFSDHTPGRDMDIAAVCMGAELLEKTITLDRTIRSAEHSFSLEPPEMKSFVNCIRDLEIALGKTRRILAEPEREMRKKNRRSATLNQTVSAGAPIFLDHFEFRRPGTGLSPAFTEEICRQGFVYSADLPKGHLFELADIAKG